MSCCPVSPSDPLRSLVPLSTKFRTNPTRKTMNEAGNISAFEEFLVNSRDGSDTLTEQQVTDL